MKKIFMTFSAMVTLTGAVVLTSCNNAEEVAKQKEEEANKIRMAVDEKLTALQTEADATCMALLDSLANEQYTTYLAEAAKGKKSTAKPKATTKKTETKADKMGGTGTTTNTTQDKASKMGGTTNTVNTPSDKASKMGGTQPK